MSSNCYMAHIHNCYTAHVQELPHSPYPVTVKQWLYILSSSLTGTCAFLYWCSDEWEWLKRQSTCHRTLGCSSSETLSSVSGDEHTGSEEETSDSVTEQQRVFVELVAATARRLFSYMEVSPQEALTHRLGGNSYWIGMIHCSVAIRIYKPHRVNDGITTKYGGCCKTAWPLMIKALSPFKPLGTTSPVTQ